MFREAEGRRSTATPGHEGRGGAVMKKGRERMGHVASGRSSRRQGDGR